jgi:methylmalonyl-CoA/ethylmalonyl-CoA epimerase
VTLIGKNMRFHHVGIACRNIITEIAEIARIHEILERSPIVFDQEQNAELCLLKIAEGLNIELISGKQVETIIKNRLSYYHLCYEVDDINAELARLEKEGAILISPPKPSILFDNREVAFLFVSYGIIEVLSSKK